MVPNQTGTVVDGVFVGRLVGGIVVFGGEGMNKRLEVIHESHLACFVLSRGGLWYGGGTGSSVVLWWCYLEFE